jgi:uncharacterized lipoprotein YmbA
VASPDKAAPAGQGAPFVIEVLPVGVPPQIDQPQMVVRTGESGLAFLENQRWGAPLGDELRSALSAELTRRLGAQDIAGLARPVGIPVLRIKLQVRRFDAWLGQAAQLDADWSMGLADKGEIRRLACHGQFDEPALEGFPELVQAQQRAIADLAGRIADDARQLARAQSARCMPGDDSFADQRTRR